MVSSNSKSSHFEILRKQAEQIVSRQGVESTDFDQTDMIRLVHELEVYQVELEIQNEELRRSTKKLEAARNRYFELYDAAPVGFVTLSENGLIEGCNRAAARMLAGDGVPMAGRSFTARVLPEDQGVCISYLRALTRQKKVDPCELCLVRRDGRRFHVQLEAAFIREPEEEGNCWRLTLVDITDRKRHEDALCSARDELEQRAEQLARLASELTLAEQRERRRLAERLHDNLQQLLAGARLHLEMLSEEDGIQKNPAYRSAYDLITDSITTARSLSSELSPPVLFQKGIIEAIEWLARWVQQTHRLEVELALDENTPTIREDLRVLLFQAVRELLFNVVKHAQADTARVEMVCREQQVTLVVSDSGTGFNSDGQNVTNRGDGGFGLFTIRERLMMLGGKCDIRSTPGDGTTVTLSVPIKTADRELSGEQVGTPLRNRRKDDHPMPAHSPEPGGKIRVLLVDDHSVMRDGLSTLLARHADIDIAGQAADGEEAVQLARQIRPDVILMDINMPKMNGLEATRRICAEMPGTRVIGLSMHEAEDQAAAMAKAGAVGFLNKSGSTDALLAAIRKA